MYRIEDNYNWKKLSQWKFVVESGNVGWKEIGGGHVGDKELENALRLLVNNCFPTAIICRCTKEHKKEILATPLWEDIFSFLNNKRQIAKAGKKVYFCDMEPKEQESVLDATIFSIWVRD